ncbi:MAG TPA: crossover junction endodeoxyribonuclease RuvC [Verrucomicrobiae bacterium]|nr:crossover junction endodeoxyribonuclease RuvC [Verrucomicrobiae bacterium]
MPERFLCHDDAVGISLQQFKQMKDRVSGRAKSSAAEPDPELRRTGSPHQIIMGVDPSLRGTGYGVIRLGTPYPHALAQGTITCPSAWEHSRCLVKIAQILRDVIRKHQPTVCVVEGLFFAQNLQTALIMGEARGAALTTLAEGGLEIYELAPRKVKQAIVGYGAAQKLAVAKMVQRMLRLPELPAPDAADALALALAHSQETGRYAINPPKRI